MNHKRIIIKLGTSTLTAGSRNLSRPHMIELVRQISNIRKNGHEVLIVSSGAIAAGREFLGFPEFPKHIPAKQMLSAVGQTVLMDVYAKLFHLYNEKVAQILLTKTDFSDRHRYLNARNTIEALLDHGVIPIINENDTVATEEICFGDNDNLSAMVSNLIDADLLILLTDQKGLYSDDPRINPDAVLVECIEDHDIPQDIWNAAGKSQNGLGTGGMITKLQAADLARRSGTAVIIAFGLEPDGINKIVNGERIGTLLTSITTKIESRKRYLLTGTKASGKLIIDKGAAKAIVNGGSLLPVGLVSINGDFDRGDAVKIYSVDGKKIAIGIINYSKAELEKISGIHSDDIEKILGYIYGNEAIHRNNMVIM